MRKITIYKYHTEDSFEPKYKVEVEHDDKKAATYLGIMDECELIGFTKVNDTNEINTKLLLVEKILNDLDGTNKTLDYKSGVLFALQEIVER